MGQPLGPGRLRSLAWRAARPPAARVQLHPRLLESGYSRAAPRERLLESGYLGAGYLVALVATRVG